MSAPPSRPTGNRLAVFDLIARRQWITVVGYVAYVVTLAAGYYYNLTFVQLGLIDLARRRVGMPDTGVAAVMALFAFGALAASLLSGRTMDRRHPIPLRARVRTLAVIVAAQTALTWAAPSVSRPGTLVVWALVGSVSIGWGIPVTFSLMSVLIPVRDRGLVAAVTAGAAFALAAVYPLEWEIERFSRALLIGMVPGVIALAAIAHPRFAFVDRLESAGRFDHTGRFRRDGDFSGRAWWWLVIVMFAIFFIDSLGFLRLIEMPVYVGSAWQAPDLGPRVFIAFMHLVGAGIGGVLYSNFDLRWTILAVFGLFAFSHLLYTFHIRFSPGTDAPLVMPMVYVLAVSFYTTVNFAAWPDVSTEADIGFRTAVGVGVAGWLASFLSTAAALYSSGTGVSLLDHLNMVEALALVFVVVVGGGWYFGRVVSLARAKST